MGTRVWSEGLVGQRFGRLVVEREAEPDATGRSRAVFRCDCGAVVTKVLTKVSQGHIQSCGCLRGKDRATPLSAMIGQRFGRLAVVGRAPSIPSRSVSGSSTTKTRWVCLCDCGVTKIISRHNLVNGTTRSCGCLLRETAADRLSRRLKGKRARNWKGVGDISGSLWNQIRYFAAQRGLEVQVTHQDIWELFQEQRGICALSGLPLHFDAVGERSQGNASLDRIDSSKGYIPGNVQWVDKRIQQMKWDMPQDEFLSLCAAVAKNHIVGP